MEPLVYDIVPEMADEQDWTKECVSELGRVPPKENNIWQNYFY